MHHFRNFYPLIIISIIVLLACGQSKINDNTLNEGVGVLSKEPKLENDTLRDPSHTSYLIDLPLAQVANLFLADSIHPTDNSITFFCMDSLLSENVETRAFFFPVFIKILEEADGALAEAAGLYALSFVEKHTRQFANLSKELTDVQLELWAWYAGNELFFNLEDEAEAKKWEKDLLNNCKACDSEELARLRKFSELAITAMKKVEEE